MLDIIKGHIKLKIEIKPVVHKIIDQVIEPALDKLVADTKTQFDDIAKASVYPGLEAKAKEVIDEKIEELKAKIPESLKDFVEIV